MLLKFLIVAGVSFPLIVVLYEFLIRRFDVARLLFDMRPKKRT